MTTSGCCSHKGCRSHNKNPIWLQANGTEAPGYLAAASDAARETVIFTLLLWVLLTQFSTSAVSKLSFLAICIFGWMVWKLGRASWLGWTRLERMHRLTAEKRWRIENKRQEELDTLTRLYKAKGFDGKLLEDAVERVVADGDRFLKVLVEEELHLSLGVHEHPLKQGLGAACGVISSSCLCLSGAWLAQDLGLGLGAGLGLTIAAGLLAQLEGNHIISAIIWNIGLAALAVLSAYFLLPMLFGGV